MKIALISCAKNKKDIPSLASEIYVSSLFKKSKEYVEKRYKNWFILSAKHGLLNPKILIEPYDVTLNNMSKKEIMEWSECVFSSLIIFKPSRIDFYAGENYRKFLIPLLEKEEILCTVPLKGMGIGKQLSFYVRNKT